MGAPDTTSDTACSGQPWTIPFAYDITLDVYPPGRADRAGSTDAMCAVWHSPEGGRMMTNERRNQLLVRIAIVVAVVWVTILVAIFTFSLRSCLYIMKGVESIK